ncbi:GNAT family N-acetyltransferase [Plantactinospora sp. WMMB782]|uniref:GNAT family N-acetyltransferase n=1 Tax=Plantactinospora sp. WMMB782 TaxID=3404121 RepID=UPI003B933BFC
MHDEDADAVLAIYQAGLDTGHASFETTAPSWAAFDAGKLPEHRHVAVDDDGVLLGWVAVSPVSTRPVYAGVVEHSVIASTEAAGIWTIQSGVFPENTASLALHQRAGFRIVGVRERIGRHAAHGGRWRDVVFIERRSPAIT